MAEDLPPLHPQVAGRTRAARPAIDIKHVVIVAVRVKMRRQDTAVMPGVRLFHGANDERVRAIAEPHAGSTILPVEDTAEHLGADHHGGFGLGSEALTSEQTLNRIPHELYRQQHIT